MPPDETLSAVISATDDVSDTLERIAQNFQDVAESATAAGAAARQAASDFDEAEDEGSALNRALNSVSEGGAAASGGMGAASGTAEGLQASFDEAEDEAADLSQSLSSVGPSSASAVGGMGSAASAAAGVEHAFDEAEDEVEDLNRELQQVVANSVYATTGIEGIGSIVDSMQSSFDYEFGLEEEEKAAHRVVKRMEEGAGIAEEQSRIGWFTDEEPEMVEAESRVVDRDADQRALDAEHWDEPEAVAHLRTEGIDEYGDSLRRIGQRQRGLQSEVEMEAEMDVDDRPLGRVESTLVRVGDRMGVLDRSSFEAEGEVDVDDSPLTRVIRSIGDVERGMDEVDGKEFEVEGEVDIDENRFQRLGARLGSQFGDSFSIASGSAMDRALDRTIDYFDADVERPSEIQEQLHGLGRSMQRLPNFQADFEGEEDLDRFAGELQTGVRGSHDLADALDEIGDDEIIHDATGLEDLTEQMSEAGYETRDARRAINRMKGEGRDFGNQLVADSGSVKEYRSQVDELGDEALDTAVRIDKLSGEARELAASAATSAASMLGLGEAIEEAGDEAGGALAKIAAFDAAVQRVGPNIADVSTTFAGFRTSLKTLAQMAPMMMSLASALGAVATAGASAAGGLGFIMAGGMLAAGEQRGDQLAAAPGDPEDMEGAMKDAHEASSDLGRSMAGIQDIMDDLKDAAFEAMAPLRTPEFADFSLWVLENAVTLLHEVAQGVAAMADPFMEFARVAQESFWETFPEVVHQMNMIVAEFLSGDLTTTVIESIPGILEAFRTEGRELIPMLSELAAEWVEVLPALMRLGTAMLKFLIPVLLGVAQGLNTVTPLTEFAAEVLTMLADALEPLIEGFFGLMGVIYGAAMTMTAATSAMVGLIAIFTGALSIVVGWVWMFGRLIQAGLWLGSAIVKLVGILTGLTATVITAVGVLSGLALAIVGLLTYFDLWDEALVGLANTWNWFIDLFARGADFITEGFENMANDAIEALNRIAKYIPGVGEQEFVDFDNSDALSQHKVSEERAREIGETMNMGERAAGGIENPADDLDPTPEGQQGPGKPQRGDRGGRRGGGQAPQNTGTVIENQYIDSSPQTDDAEIMRAARSAVESANQKERRRRSPLN